MYEEKFTESKRLSSCRKLLQFRETNNSSEIDFVEE